MMHRHSLAWLIGGTDSSLAVLAIEEPIVSYFS